MKSCKKTDKNDAKLLAEFLSKDILPRARVKDILDDRLHSLVDSRNKFVELRTQLKNKVHNLLNRCGIKIKKTSLTSQKGLNKVLSYEVDELVRFELEQLIAEIKTLIERGSYDKVKTRRGFAKAIVATARKLLTIIYYTLKNDWYFTDFAKYM